ncbi:hypothetical protein B0H14DRAFT_3436473 [Mycena olivaceomarginata]|nr:hypothetical protein B0H14DRAFT_3436473 [Mycena olivaceomarginata]
MSIPTVYAVPPNAGAFPVYRNIWNRSPQSVALQGYHIQSTSQYGYLLQEPTSGLHKYLQHFFPCYYNLRDSPHDKRATFFIDRDGLIFMYRSFCVAELMASTPDRSITSAQAPRLTKWHLDYMERMNKFMELPIVKAIIGIVSNIVTTIFPRMATHFLADVEWHRKRYGIKPMFGLFWNLCLNAWFPGQHRIHCRPHADKANQIGVCVLLIYMLKTALQFDHHKYTWLVIWEAGVVVELPPWVILIYPSVFSIISTWMSAVEIEFVTMDSYAHPTPENSHPIVNSDNEETGFDTLKKARAAGLSGISDFGASVQEAFSCSEYFHKISPLF